MKPTLLILAAGMGSRYGGLKQIDPVGPDGETVLDYSVYDACRAGFARVVFVIRRDIEAAFRDAVGARFARHVDIDYSFQQLDQLPDGFSVPNARRKPWGTGQAVLAARQHIDTPFAVINADDFYGLDSYRVLAAFLDRQQPGTERSNYAMVGFRMRHTLSDHGSVARGLCAVNEAGYLTGVEELTGIEKTAAGARHTEPDGTARNFTGEELVSMNMWGFTPEIFPQLEQAFRRFLAGEARQTANAEFYIPSAVNELVAGGDARVRVLRTHSSWFGVTYRDDKKQVEASIRRLVAEGLYPAPLWA